MLKKKIMSIEHTCWFLFLYCRGVAEVPADTHEDARRHVDDEAEHGEDEGPTEGIVQLLDAHRVQYYADDGEETCSGGGVKI